MRRARMYAPGAVARCSPRAQTIAARAIQARTADRIRIRAGRDIPPGKISQLMASGVKSGPRLAGRQRRRRCRPGSRLAAVAMVIHHRRRCPPAHSPPTSKTTAGMRHPLRDRSVRSTPHSIHSKLHSNIRRNRPRNIHPTTELTQRSSISAVRHSRCRQCLW